MARSGFIFGGNTGETPETLKRKRLIAEALATNGRAPRNVGEGLTAIGEALAYRRLMSDVTAGEAAGLASTQGPMAAIAAALGGKSAFPAAPSSSGASNAAAASAPSSGGAFEAKAASVIPRLASDLGISPEQAAGIVGQLGHESEGLQAINERNPMVPGSRGGFGWAQWTGPRRREFEGFAQKQGLDPSSDDANYAFLLHELKNTPESAVLADLKGAPDAQTAGRIFTDKFLRPGIPGYGSRAKWTDRALAAYQGAAPPPAVAAIDQMAGQPAQVASLDPSIGLPTEQPVQAAGIQNLTGAPSPGMGAPGTPVAATPEGQRALAQMLQPGSMTGGAPMPIQGQPQAAPQPSQQVAQALQPPPQAQQPMPELAGNTQDLGGGINLQMLMDAANNPWLNDNQSGIVNALMGQQLKERDPATALERRKLELELRNLENPVGDPFTLGEGQVRYGGGGNKIAEGPQKAPDNPTEVREYEYYVSQERAAGREPEPYNNWRLAGKRAGASSVTVGGGDNKQVFDAMATSLETARAASTGYNAIQEANKALDAGIISGAGANLNLGLQKIGALLGVTDPTIIQNTETFRSAIAPQVSSMIKATVGSANISNTDREFAEKAVGGNIELDAGSIKRLMGIMEKMSRATVDRHRSTLDKVYPEGGGFDRERALFSVDALPEVAPVGQPDALGGPARPTTDAEYNALPSGSLFIDPDDGKTYRKP